MRDESWPTEVFHCGDHPMHYVDVGAGPVVVLVHGSPISSYAFRESIERLVKHSRVIAPDLLGFGDSPAPSEGADFVLQSQTLRALLEHLALERFGLLGHDWGGPVALGAVAHDPEKVDRLVLMNTTIAQGFAPPWYWRPMISRGIGDLLHERINLFGRGLPLLLKAARDPALRRRYAAPFERLSTRRTVLKLERLSGYAKVASDFAEAKPRLEATTLILWGTPDPYFRPQERDKLMQIFPEAKLMVLPGAGHFALEDASAKVASEVDRFFHQAV